jgi:NADPH:quinone reductase-like Zn-dependent oxidoreductase
MRHLFPGGAMTMKAAQYDRYGGTEVIEIREIPRPVAGVGELLVRVAASAVNPKDALTRGGKFKAMAGRVFPKGIGYDFAGIVEALGEGVSGFAPGEPVFGMLNGWTAGTAADYVLAQPDATAPKPAALDFAAAAALPLAAQTALQALRDLAGVGAGSTVLIHGASGGVGTLAVQIAKALGARVTALCGADSAGLVRGLGADEVIDYRQQPPETLTVRYDCFFDVFGNQSFGRVKAQLAPRGVYVTTVPNRRNVIDHLRTRFWPGRRARLVVVRSKRADLETLSGWVADGSLKPVIAGRFALDELRQAHEAIQSRRTHGKLIIDVANLEKTA